VNNNKNSNKNENFNKMSFKEGWNLFLFCKKGVKIDILEDRNGVLQEI